LEPFDELIEFVENLGLTEIESLTLGHVSHLFFCGLISFFILSVELNAASQNLNHFSWVSFPHIFNFRSWWNDFFLAVLDHLIGNLDEQSSHFV
jgi:hypothetical protein